ncbi:hypothetical protein [Runella slithyformis]|uniref:Uncharacterized protein n=1 Tax=Runella slithyformis (strain ATCC 29530 / DSM 19594 / LMG 11500 / NCIMB 11436 / LSU 4) TaxID=761193 RepID=A0A7U3ZR24_RUNSL|nr:hypothetical protein [Runella slithyformis]AEI51781.1 hypothetical protein Runsl_5491 [Runella slithyformis DSM 19594]
MNKMLFTLSMSLVSQMAVAQISNDNSLSVQVDGKEFKTAPRRIRIGNAWYITANAVNPDKSLRFWFATWNHTDTPEVGLYKIVDEEFNGEKTLAPIISEGKYKGVAYVKYVEETRSPRMEYHVGKSRRENGGEIEVIKAADGFLEGKFSCTLDGTHFKEKTSATALGGLGRLKGKLEDKVFTGATGYDSDIDPEGRGYKKQDTKDEIVLSGGVFKLKFEK